MTEPKHPGQRPLFFKEKPQETLEGFELLGSSLISFSPSEKFKIPDGATFVSVDSLAKNPTFSFFKKKDGQNPNFETELAAFYEALDNHRKELAKWEEGMAVWNIYQKEIQIERLRGEIEELKKNSLTTEQKEVD